MHDFQNSASSNSINPAEYPMKRIAIYGRYSSKLQSQSSIEDQFNIINHHVDKQPGWKIVGRYQDAAISGSNFISRPGIRQLMEDAQRGKFDIIMAEALDRFTRDQADAAILHKRMDYYGVQILTLSEGIITELHIGLKGTMNALYIKDLAEKTKRGMRGRVEAGFFAGGKCYGYKTLKKFGHDGKPITGLREIVEAEAVIICRIFQEFADGRSPRAIAHILNAEKIKGPRDKGWSDTTIRGHYKRGTGIINNVNYIGRLTWDKSFFKKNLETGRRISRLNPLEKRVNRQLSDLRIVDDSLWSAVRKRQEEISTRYAGVTASIQPYHTNNRLSDYRRPVSLLSGKVFCAKCGGHYSLRGSKRFVCSSHIGQGTCDNGRTILRHTLENMVVSGCKRLLLNPALSINIRRAFELESRRLQGDALIGTKSLKIQIYQIDKEIAALLNAIKAGMLQPSMKAELDQLERNKAELAVQYNTSTPDQSSAPVEIENLLFEKLNDLPQALNQPEIIHIAGEIMRSLIDTIVIHPHPLRGHMEVRISGPIAATFQYAENPKDHNQKV